MKVLSLEQIKEAYPDEWVLLQIEESEAVKPLAKGRVLLHGKDYLELCYKDSEIAKDYLTTIFFTGKTTKHRKWLKAIRLQESQKTI